MAENRDLPRELDGLVGQMSDVAELARSTATAVGRLEGRVQTLWEAHLSQEERHTTRAYYGADPEALHGRVKVLKEESRKMSAQELAVRASWSDARTWALGLLGALGGIVGIWSAFK